MSDTFTFTVVSRATPKGGLITGGTRVTITGVGFDFATGGVTFGGVAALNVIVVNSTTIAATAPPHAKGVVDIVVAGVGTGRALYTYQTSRSVVLPRVPVASNGALELDTVGAVKWLMQVKQVIEGMPGLPVDAGTIVGLTVDQIPELPWTKIDTTGSSLADLSTRSASDLSSGILSQAFGGTGRANAYSAAPGTFSIASGTFALQLSRLTLTGSQRLVGFGTGRLGVI